MGGISAVDVKEKGRVESAALGRKAIRGKGVSHKYIGGRDPGWVFVGARILCHGSTTGCDCTHRGPRVLTWWARLRGNGSMTDGIRKMGARHLRLSISAVLFVFFISFSIAFSFSGCGGVGVEEQIRLLKSKDPVVRINAAFKLGNSGSKKAVMPLVKALSDKDIRVRRRAAEALGKVGDGRAAEPLVKCLGDKDASLRVLSRQSLVKIGGPAVSRLIPLLGSENERLRKEAGEILVAIGAASVKPLIALLEHENPDIRVWAATLLGEIGFIEAHDPLKKALQDPDERVRAAAAVALEKITTASKGASPQEGARQEGAR